MERKDCGPDPSASLRPNIRSCVTLRLPPARLQHISEAQMWLPPSRSAAPVAGEGINWNALTVTSRAPCFCIGPFDFSRPYFIIAILHLIISTASIASSIPVVTSWAFIRSDHGEAETRWATLAETARNSNRQHLPRPPQSLSCFGDLLDF